MKNGTPLWREAHLYVKMSKTPHGRSHFGSCDLENWHAALARSTFVRQNVQNTSWSEPFWKLRSAKLARRCGAKHIYTSKCTKHHNLGAIFEVAIWKNGTALWREAHFQVKMYKTPHARSHFGSCDLEKLRAAVARSTFPSQNVQNTSWSEPFWKFRSRKMARRCGEKHICKLKCTKHFMLATVLEVAIRKTRHDVSNSLTN